MFHDKIFRKDEEKVEKSCFNGSFPSSGSSGQFFYFSNMHCFVALETLYRMGGTRKMAHFNFVDRIFEKDGKMSENSVSNLFGHF